MKRVSYFILSLVGLLLGACSMTPGAQNRIEPEAVAVGPTAVSSIVFLPQRDERLIVNPYCGYSLCAERESSVTADPQPSLVWVTMVWNQIQPNEGVLDTTAMEEEYRFAYWRSRGVKAIIRVIMDWPGTRAVGKKNVPDWLYEKLKVNGVVDGVVDYNYAFSDGTARHGFSPNYANPTLQKYHSELIRLLAEKYDTDPFIAFVELGSVGHWGEWHNCAYVNDRIPFPKTDITDRYLDDYYRYFTHKPLLIRRPMQRALDYGFGLFCDALDSVDQTDVEYYRRVFTGSTWWQNGEMHPAMPDFWKISPMGGQWIGTDVDAMNQASLADLQRRAATFHSTYLTSNTSNVAMSAEQRVKFLEFQKSLGYRFVIDRVEAPSSMLSGTNLPVSAEVTNIGNAPFYFDWKLGVGLMDASGQVLAPQDVANVRDWLPGQSYPVSCCLSVPDSIPDGDYTLVLFCKSPIQGDPGIKFAVKECDSVGIVRTFTVKVKRRT